jgi:large subunit ribosomal protein L13
MVLRGKNKPEFTPHLDTGDFVVVVNADQLTLTGNKLDQKMYYRHSGYMGGIKETSARQLLKKKPEEILRHAVRGMLPKNSLGRHQLKKLKIYIGSEHPHEAQQPVSLTWED